MRDWVSSVEKASDRNKRTAYKMLRVCAEQKNYVCDEVYIALLTSWMCWIYCVFFVELLTIIIANLSIYSIFSRTSKIICYIRIHELLYIMRWSTMEDCYENHGLFSQCSRFLGFYCCFTVRYWNLFVTCNRSESSWDVRSSISVYLS